MVKPTTMLYRNLLAMEVEELIRSHPLDGVVLMGGCDKTTPGVLMGAISADIPAIFVPAGPMLRGYWRGRTLGSGTDVWGAYADYRAGKLDADTLEDMVAGLARSAGTCMTMGTAATMMSIAETLGFTLPGASSLPAVDANHQVMCAASGRRIVGMVWEDLKPSDILSPASFDNAITVDMAIGGSTNAIIHLVAIAGRAGIELPLSRFDEKSRTTPVLVNLKPSGKYLMEDFYYAGGLPAVLRELGENALLNKDALTVNGKTLWENNQAAPCHNHDVITPFSKPFKENTGIAVLRGNLCPDGAIIKPSAATPALMKHRGRAVVFSNI
jgi:dihydroxyacid dehydratase/phosphogluconate dehydratase